MRIGGIEGFLARQTRRTIAASGGATQPFAARRGDVLELSEAGKRLSLERADFAKIDNRNAAARSDPIAKLMGKSLSEVETVLEKMKALAVAAQNDALSSCDRIGMQIEMEKLREELREVSGAMSASFAKSAGVKDTGAGPGASVLSAVGPFDDGTTLLERARERILNGQPWDVAKGVEVLGKLEELLVDGRSIKVEDGTFFTPPEDIDLDTAVFACIGQYTGGGWYVTDDPEAPTVSQKLKESGTIILMDPKSAAEGVERLQREIDRLAVMREELVAFAAENRDSSAFSATQDSRPSDAEVELLIAGINREAEAKKGTQEDSEEDSGAGVARTFQTALGLVGFPPDASGPRLVEPKNPKGVLFAKIEKLFDALCAELAGGRVSEAPSETRFSWTNADLTRNKAA